MAMDLLEFATALGIATVLVACLAFLMLVLAAHLIDS
jgi:hypothetical protein